MGVGDSLNDLPMLLVVDHPILIKGESSYFPGAVSTLQDLTIAEGAGPRAWNEAVLNKLKELEN
jgi:mannosyl-3-phosphoglycerate phosphatase